MAKKYIVHCMDKSGVLLDSIEINGVTPNDAEVNFSALYHELYHQSHRVELLQPIRTLKNGDEEHEVPIEDKFDRERPIQRNSFKRRRDDF